MVMENGHRVLIVDDAPWVSDTLAVIFSTSGYDAKALRTAEDASVEIRLRPPALVILDVMLPGMNGVDLAISIIEDYPLTRILLFSGRDRAFAIVDEAAKRGFFFELLTKPVPPKVMLARAERMLATWKT